MRFRTILVVTATLVCMRPAEGQKLNLPTTPERTNYEETSRHADVIAFLQAVDLASSLVRLDSVGRTFENRLMPLAIVSNLDLATAAAVRASGKTVIYLQGNIHAGEVEGKEVLQMLLREIAEGQHRHWLDSLVLLVNPIYNADGNERIGHNRGRQHGPLKGMGVRPNAQGFDLNRDHMKVESPEARALTRMLNAYDPHVGVDLHTTDGSLHGYYLTYSPPLHPSTHPSIIALLRERWLPEVTRQVKGKHDWDFYYYGNYRGGDPARGWSTFEHVPRFNNNYVGIRNRIGILSEAYSYATFEDRIKATYFFVTEVLEYAYRHASEVRRVVDQAERASVVGQQLTTRARITATGTPVSILVGEVIREVNPHSGDTIWRRADLRRPVQTLEFGTFDATELVTAPKSYFVPPAWAQRVVPLLDHHGVRHRSLRRDSTVQADRFRIDSTSVAPRPFQNHRERTLFGAYQSTPLTLPAGTIVIDLDQPLGRLAFLLLEPRSDDGLVNWNYFDPEIEREPFYPVVRSMR